MTVIKGTLCRIVLEARRKWNKKHLRRSGKRTGRRRRRRGGGGNGGGRGEGKALRTQEADSRRRVLSATRAAERRPVGRPAHRYARRGRRWIRPSPHARCGRGDIRRPVCCCSCPRSAPRLRSQASRSWLLKAFLCLPSSPMVARSRLHGRPVRSPATVRMESTSTREQPAFGPVVENLRMRVYRTRPRASRLVPDRRFPSERAVAVTPRPGMRTVMRSILDHYSATT
jgi:hypothetical protein